MSLFERARDGVVSALILMAYIGLDIVEAWRKGWRK